jgi:hypothetical protein
MSSDTAVRRREKAQMNYMRTTRFLGTIIESVNQLMRVQIEPHTDLRAAPRSLHRGERRIEIIEIIDQWYGSGYRYVKVRGHDRSVCILRFDEIDNQWGLIMFSSARAQGLATRAT